MATIINNRSSDTESKINLLIGVLLALSVAGIFFFIYALSAVPDTDGKSTIVVPEKIDLQVTDSVN